MARVFVRRRRLIRDEKSTIIISGRSRMLQRKYAGVSGMTALDTGLGTFEILLSIRRQWWMVVVSTYRISEELEPLLWREWG